MYLVIELESGQPDELVEQKLELMLRWLESDRKLVPDATLDLGDSSGRSLKAEVTGVFKSEFTGLVPYVTREVQQ